MPSEKLRDVDKAILEWIALDLQPFCAVERPSFRKILNLLSPGYKPPSRKTVSGTMLRNAYSGIVGTLKQDRMSTSHAVITFDLRTCTKNQKQMELKLANG
ncbi:zinc finger BED domain-containing protein 1-like isoform X1 [Acipenser oxyrinchus oxyrinchus]|uniref:Zinc finger BED domain-containing protein 1-like isoform X1 n=1 Tax=Acipenser oxyrinchus oxyrinchus TaxID=40147 RepID=A0AAD8GGB2_ACIOX|nr:zinc finger BED domain-containing protein 1-like isoform X1 [Acipenser oxyrinchus oxyrinchus]